MVPISKLTVHRLRAEYKEPFKKFLEDHGVIWEDGSEEVCQLEFLEGTTTKRLELLGMYEYHRIRLPDGGELVWFQHKKDRWVSILISMALLLRSSRL